MAKIQKCNNCGEKITGAPPVKYGGAYFCNTTRWEATRTSMATKGIILAGGPT